MNKTVFLFFLLLLSFSGLCSELTSQDYVQKGMKILKLDDPKAHEVNFSKEESKAAIDEFNKALELDPKNEKAYLGKLQAVTFLSFKNPSGEDIKELRKIYSEYIRNCPTSTLAYKNHLLFCLNNNLFEEGISSGDEWIKLDPQDIEAWFMRGSARLNTFNIEGYRDMLQVEKLQKQNPNSKVQIELHSLAFARFVVISMDYGYIICPLFLLIAFMAYRFSKRKV